MNRKKRLSRGWKVILSIPALLIMAWFLVTMWGFVKKEQRDLVAEFRMAERRYWMGPSEIQYVGDRYGVIGTYMDQVVCGQGYWPRNLEGPTLVPVENAFVAVDVPKGTARAELTLKLSFYYIPALSGPTYAGPTYAVREEAERWSGEAGEVVLWQDIYKVQGELAKEGGVLFRLEPKAPDVPGELGNWDGLPLWEVSHRDNYARDPRDNMAWARMTAIFYDETGAELGRAALQTPEGGENLAD